MKNRTWLLVIPDHKPPSLNVWLSKHWGKRSNDKASIGWLVRKSVADDGIPRPIECRVDITIEAWMSMPIDPDNIPIKGYVDGLRYAQVLIDDDTRWVNRVSSRVVQLPKGEMPHVCILIEEVV